MIGSLAASKLLHCSKCYVVCDGTGVMWSDVLPVKHSILFFCFGFLVSFVRALVAKVRRGISGHLLTLQNSIDALFYSKEQRAIFCRLYSLLCKYRRNKHGLAACFYEKRIILVCWPRITKYAVHGYIRSVLQLCLKTQCFVANDCFILSKQKHPVTRNTPWPEIPRDQNHPVTRITPSYLTALSVDLEVAKSV